MRTLPGYGKVALGRLRYDELITKQYFKRRHAFLRSL
jgi:hypothetical protein